MSAKTFGTPTPVKMTKTATTTGYSLIELMVVIAVITIIGLTSIPNLFNRNDRLLLDSSANQLRQVIIEAATRAKAPDKNDSAGSPQVFQVSFGKFTTANIAGVENGEVTANSISLERGLTQCDTGDLQGGFTTLRNITLPRGIYIASFYPSNQTALDDRAVIRFAVGDDSFSCGSYNNPIYKSGQLFISSWAGKNKANGNTVARYLVVALGSQKVGDKRYVTLDRVTHQVAITRSNPQSYFTPVVDNLTPQWNDDDPPNRSLDPNKFTISVACGTSESDITISYPRAKDRVNDPGTVDPNLFVAYNINWQVVGSPNPPSPLAINYFYDLAADIVRYQFTTDSFTVANQPKTVTVTIAALDSLNQTQPVNDADPLLKQRSKDFTLSCGSVISDPKTDPTPPPVFQDDPPGTSTSCNPIIPITKTEQKILKKIAGVFISRAQAAQSPCVEAQL
ncbi:MAG: prepilin-type N-terminal cleavage/methylation domain-containing protein [Candidatus Berkelbacteria bacterium]|nr:prepilin-type N-terminal cleavage/methylation domain-containing protein [Candidatus Berkelbacteria bacterium]